MPKIVLVVIFIAAAVLAVQARARCLARADSTQTSNAFDSYMRVVPALIYQHQPYTSDAFPLPPFAMLFVAPFTHLSRPNAQAAWVLCKPWLFVPIFLLTLSMVRRSGTALDPRAVGLILLAWFFPLIGDIQEGQMNLLMLLPLTLALWTAQSNSKRGDALAGLLLAMAICIKVTPLAFLPYFLLRRRWRIAGFTGLGIVLWLVFAPALVFGWDQNWAWLDQWAHIMILPYTLHAAVKFTNGESIPEVITRFLSHAPAWVGPDAAGHDVPHYVNVLDLSPPVIHLLGRAVLVLVALAGWCWARRPVHDFRCRRYLVEIGGVSVFMLMASERTWVHHYVTLLLALAAVAMIASDPVATERSRKRAWLALLLAAAVIPLTSDVAKLAGPDGRHYSECLDVVLIAAVALVCALTRVSYHHRPDVAFEPCEFHPA